jgi:ATP-dependent Clp protease adaptor protein ClpS
MIGNFGRIVLETGAGTLPVTAMPIARGARRSPARSHGACAFPGRTGPFLRISPDRRRASARPSVVLLKNVLQSSNMIPNWVGRQAMSNQEQHGSVLEAERTRVKPPPLYKVVLLNDDYTPMDFVVVVLQTVFSMSREKATLVMLQVHREGMGVCGTYTREVAATKVEQVINLARKHQHPLQCTMEET